MKTDILILGAGMAGLSVARHLVERKFAGSWHLLDKGRSVGGRMATRRVESLKFDHGAQFFTVRSAEFHKVLDSLGEESLAREWCRGFLSSAGNATDGNDGFPRYAVKGGMNALAKRMAQDLPSENLTLSERIVRLEWSNIGWKAIAESGASWEANQLVITFPLPQTVALLQASALVGAEGLINTLAAVEYDPCIALMLLLPEVADALGERPYKWRSGSLAFLGDNCTKQVSPSRGSWTVHLGAEASRRLFDAPDEAVLAFALEALKAQFPQAPWTQPKHSQIHRWRYAEPKNPFSQSFLAWPTDSPSLYFAGESFGSPRIETAFLSGLAVSKQLAGDDWED